MLQKYKGFRAYYYRFVLLLALALFHLFLLLRELRCDGEAIEVLLLFEITINIFDSYCILLDAMLEVF
jgi:hypothetical protein